MYQLMTPSEAAALLGISADRVRQLGDEGRIPVQRTTTGHRLFLRSDVEVYLLERKRRKDAEGG